MSVFTITTAVNSSSLLRLGAVAGLAWTRSTTTATVTQTAHGMITGNLLNVTVTSDAAAITLGVKSVTVTGANTYTFTCLNAGAASGTVTGNHVDDCNINGGYLTFDTHTRYGFGSNTSAAMGAINMSATLGGTVEFNSTLVRLIPYNTATGNVPALDTVISQGSASGKLIGVYSALNVAPTVAGSAMPATGFILVRQWNSIAYAAGALTGVAASATAADRAGWLDIVGLEAATSTVNRLNTFKVRGDYYDFLGATTDGVRASTYQIPSNGSLVYRPGVEVETGVGTDVYEFYPCAGTITALVTNIATDAVRGKYCWISTAGLVRFGSDATNSTGGYIPPAGLKVRIANVFFSNATQANPTVTALPNVTLATRYEFATTGGGVIDIDKASVGWYMNFAQAFSVSLTNTSTFSAIVLTECASPIAWSNVSVGQEAANSQTALTMGLNFAGGSLTNCTWTRSAQATGVAVTQWTDCAGFSLTNDSTRSLVKAANAGAASVNLTRVTNSTWVNALLGGGRVALVGCADLVFTNAIYYDHPAITTTNANGMYVWDYSTAPSFRVKMDGLTFGGLTLCQPYNGIINVGVAGCQNLTVRNLGTAAAPLNCGGTAVGYAAFTRATTVMTVTSTAHGLKVNDQVAVYATDSPATRAVTTSNATLWTIASVPTANTFTVTVTNAGNGSGGIAYYPCMSGNFFNGLAGGAPLNLSFQRCYAINMRGGINTTSDNSAKGITFENVWLTDWATQTLPLLNAKFKGCLSTVNLSIQISVYGTHFVDYYNSGIPDQLVAVPWTRATTTASLTVNANHNMKTGDLVTVSVSSDIAAVVLGTKSIVSVYGNIITFTCLNAGAASGTLTIQPHNGKIAIMMNEPTADTASQVSLANGAAFTSAGGLYMPVIAHQADFTAPADIRGHSSFPVAEAIMAGGTISNYNLFYSMDGGTTYKNLYYQRTGAGGASASTNVTMTSTAGVAVDDYIWGTNIAPLAKVVSITNATTVVVDRANIGTVSGTLRFNHLPSEVVTDALVGFPLKVRIITLITNTTAITSLALTTTSTIAARAATYALDVATVQITGLVSGSRVKAEKISNGEVLFNGVETAGVVNFTTDQTVPLKITARKGSFAPYYKEWVTQLTPVTSATTSAVALQDLDE